MSIADSLCPSAVKPLSLVISCTVVWVCNDGPKRLKCVVVPQREKKMQLARLAWIVAIATHPQDCYLDKGHAGELQVSMAMDSEYPCLPMPPPSLFSHCLKLFDL